MDAKVSKNKQINRWVDWKNPIHGYSRPGNFVETIVIFTTFLQNVNDSKDNLFPQNISYNIIASEPFPVLKGVTQEDVCTKNNRLSWETQH